MIPVFIGLGLGLAAILSATAYFWDDIFDSASSKSKWDGKRITILGSREVGKSTLFDFLQNREINPNKKYEQTRTAQKISKVEVNIDGAVLQIETSYDVGGGLISHLEWLEQIRQSDYVFYLLDANKVLKSDHAHISEIRRDMNAIREEIGVSSEKKVYLIATKSDQHHSYKDSDFDDNLMRTPIISETRLNLGGTNRCKLIIGSLSTTDEAKNLVKKFLNNN